MIAIKLVWVFASCNYHIYDTHLLLINVYWELSGVQHLVCGVMCIANLVMPLQSGVMSLSHIVPLQLWTNIWLISRGKPKKQKASPLKPASVRLISHTPTLWTDETDYLAFYCHRGLFYNISLYLWLELPPTMKSLVKLIVKKWQV